MRFDRLLLLLLWCTASTFAADLPTVTFTVDGQPRTALLYVPPKNLITGPMPLVFVYHGHGGNSNFALRTFNTNTLWPAAISIYPQGVKTANPVVDPQGNMTGWQMKIGELGDRDLHFFDVMLKQLQLQYLIDPRRIYCAGHSNGGSFTYLLWDTHPDTFAAFAACSAAAGYARQLKPKPVFISGGRDDSIVKFAWQQAMIDILLKTDGCGSGEPWQSVGTLYPSATGTPLATYIYDGGHMMDPKEAGLIVKFFQAQGGPTTQP